MFSRRGRLCRPPFCREAGRPHVASFDPWRWTDLDPEIRGVTTSLRQSRDLERGAALGRVGSSFVERLVDLSSDRTRVALERVPNPRVGIGVDEQVQTGFSALDALRGRPWRCPRPRHAGEMEERWLFIHRTPRRRLSEKMMTQGQAFGKNKFTVCSQKS